jgi:iron complex outermembrane receptor protein
MRHTSPRLALLLQPTSGTTIKAIAGLAFRPPNAFESDYAFAGTNLPNPGLRHEHVHGRELGIEHHYGRDRQVAAQVYSNRLDNLIALETDATSGLAQHRNVGRVDMRGSSVDARWRFGEIIAAGSISWQDVRHESGARLSNTPNRLIKLRLAAPLGGAQFVWETRHTGSRLADSGSILTEGGHQGGFAVSDLAINGRLGTGTEWQVRATNVFDRRYGHVVGNEFNASFPGTMTQPMPVMIQDGRSLEARLRLRF